MNNDTTKNNGAERGLHYEVDELGEIMRESQKSLVVALKKLIPTKPDVAVLNDKMYFEPNYESAMKIANDLLSHWRNGAFIITSNKIVSGENETTGRAMVIMPPNDANCLTALLLKKPDVQASSFKDPMVMSALEETLNIIANSFITAIANYYKKRIWLGPSKIVNSATFDDIIIAIAERKREVHVIFENNLAVSQNNINVFLFIFLSPDIFKRKS